MLKLPKGLKKKKNKKSKKNQELFTEEELEQYKRQQRALQEAAEEEARQREQQADVGPSKPKTEDDEWSKFKQLTTGVDSILKKTQGELERIKEQSFFQRIEPKKPEPKVEEKAVESKEEKQLELTEEELEEQRRLAELKGAVVELSESEEESEEADDIFDTNYIDTLTSGNVPLAYVPESPEETDLGPDPFDTAYADKLIKGPEVSKRGKKIVNIGSAVEVLTGKVEKVSSAAALKRPRRGLQNLLLESFDQGEVEPSDSIIDEIVKAEEKPTLTLLDDLTDFVADAPIDLTASLHLEYLKQRGEEEKEAEQKRLELEALKELEKDEFDELAAESLTKKDEVIVVTSNTVAVAPVLETETNWCELEREPEIIGQVDLDENDDLDFDEDPFNTDFVATVVREKSIESDDFDPRADEKLEAPEVVKPIGSLTVKQKDLLCGSATDLTDLSHVPVITASESIEQEIDPFDTSAVNAIVQPKETEIKFLEKELLSATLKQSLSDPDFDPRAGEEKPASAPTSLAERKSSLVLNVQKTVVFAINENLFATEEDKPRKPVTPYYPEKSTEAEKPDLLCVSETHDIKVLTPAGSDPSEEQFDDPTIDPFDTSNASVALLPGKTELKLIESELIERLETPVTTVLDINSDSQELGLGGKVLTPQITLPSEDSIDDVDPFDTSFANNIAPGQAEIKVLESELIHQ